MKRFVLEIVLALIMISYGKTYLNHEKLDLQNKITQLDVKVKNFYQEQEIIFEIFTIIDHYNRRMSVQEKRMIAYEIYQQSIKYPELNVALICAVITHESARTWRPNIESPAGAVGLMQIMPITGIFLANQLGISWEGHKTLTHPLLNIRMGCLYLSQLIKKYGVHGALIAYNSGENSVKKWILKGKTAQVLPKETQKYVPKILFLYKKFDQIPKF